MTAVIVRTAGRVRHLTLNRPGVHNALDADVLARLGAELAAVADDPAVGAVLLDGAGERAFSAGADLTELAGLDAASARALLERGQQVMTAIEELPVPVVAAVDGVALGGGFEIVLACPVVLASDRSRFGLPEARLGLVPGYGGTQRLRRAVGHAPAMGMLLTGRPVDAAQAWQLGLLSAPPERPGALASTAAAVAADIAGLSRANLALMLDATRSPGGTEGLAREMDLAALAIGSVDGQEGIAAFRAQRSPRFGA